MLEDVLNELLEWKWWTDENKPVQWGISFPSLSLFFPPEVMSLVFICGWWLSHICYCYITWFFKQWQKTMEYVWSVIYAAWAFFVLQTPCSICYYILFCLC
jgi:hypothetical protein